MKKLKVLKLFKYLLLSALLLYMCKDVFGQSPPVNSPKARANAIKYVNNTIENFSQEKPKVFSTNDKYVRFIMAPPGTSFAIDLVENADVVISPGRAFGENGENYMRIALVENEQRLRQAVRNISRYVKKLPKRIL